MFGFRIRVWSSKERFSKLHRFRKRSEFPLAKSTELEVNSRGTIVALRGPDY